MNVRDLNGRRRSRRSRTRRPRGPVPQLSSLVHDFSGWRITKGLAPEDAELVEVLAELKGEELASPDPTVWTAALLTELLEEVVPRSGLLDEREQERLLPTFRDYLVFLIDMDRATADPASRAALVALVTQLSRTVPPSRRDPLGRRHLRVVPDSAG